MILIEWGTDEYAFHIPGSILIDTAHIVWCSSVHLSRRSTAAGTGTAAHASSVVLTAATGG